MHTLRLVNKAYGLGADYKPPHLMQDSFSKVWLCREVFKAVRAANRQLCHLGMEQLVIISGYRTYTYQAKLFERKIAYYRTQGFDEIAAKEQAAQIVAKPGHSEHQLGLAVDLTTWSMKDLEDPLITDFAQTETGKWLLVNSFRFGLILRYPEDKVAMTHITYEPWHYRYVGKGPAYAMHEKGLCLEEYLGVTNG